jgi:hypothetical protein
MEDDIVMEMDSNEKVAKTVVSKLKEAKLIPNDETIAEKKIANGSIKEADWKVLFEQQIRELEKQAPIEAK